MYLENDTGTSSARSTYTYSQARQRPAGECGRAQFPAAVEVHRDEWSISVATMYQVTTLQPVYYGSSSPVPGDNPGARRAGLRHRRARACGAATAGSVDRTALRTARASCRASTSASSNIATAPGRSSHGAIQLERRRSERGREGRSRRPRRPLAARCGADARVEQLRVSWSTTSTTSRRRRQRHRVRCRARGHGLRSAASRAGRDTDWSTGWVTSRSSSAFDQLPARVTTVSGDTFPVRHPARGAARTRGHRRYSS